MQTSDQNPFETVLTHEEAAKYLKMSMRRLHNLKGTGLPYSQYGKKILYRKKDLDDFLRQ